MNGGPQFPQQQSAHALNRSIAIDGAVSFAESRGRLVTAVMRDPSGVSSAEISLMGAHVLSATLGDSRDIFYLSGTSKLEAGEAIRGGNPVILGWFGRREDMAKDYPSHGFGRVMLWRATKAEVEGHETVLLLELDNSQLSRHSIFGADPAWVDKAFSAQMELRIGPEELKQTLRFTNMAKEVVPFQGGFHPYFAVSDYRGVIVRGLQGHEFRDMYDASGSGTQDSPELKAEQSIYRIYRGWNRAAENHFAIQDPASNRTLNISGMGMGECVVWNPGEQRASKPHWNDIDSLADRFLCVDPTDALEKRMLAPGETVEFTMRVSLSPSTP